MRRVLGFALAGPMLYLVVALGVALALSWAGAGLAVWWLDGKLETANARATKAEAARAAEEQSRKGFQAAAGSCSASVAALERRAASAELAYTRKQGESQALSSAVQAHINALLNRPRPAGLSECDAMRGELDAEVDYRAARRR